MSVLANAPCLQTPIVALCAAVLQESSQYLSCLFFFFVPCFWTIRTNTMDAKPSDTGSFIRPFLDAFALRLLLASTFQCPSTLSFDPAM